MNAKLVCNRQLKVLYQDLIKDKCGSYIFEDHSGDSFTITFTKIGYKMYNSESRSRLASGIRDTVALILGDLTWIKSILRCVTTIGISEVTLSDEECSRYSRILSELQKIGVLGQGGYHEISNK